MAQELISDLVLQQAFDQLARLEKSVESNTEKFVKLTEQILKFNDALGKGGSGGGGSKSSVNQQIDELEKLKRQIESYNEKIEAQKTLIGQLAAEQKNSYREAVKANTDFAKSIGVSGDSVAGLERQLAATKKEIWGMNDAMLKSARGKELIEHYKKLNTEVGSLEQKMGIFRRNVGNYASGFNAMGNAVMQLTREMPNFAQSVQIGILSLSNNVGAFQDAVTQIRAQNKLLQAEGKPTVSVLKQVGAAFFSWNTLIMAGVSALVAYGPKISEWISSLHTATVGQKELNAAMLEGQKSAQQEVVHLDRLYKTLTDNAKSNNERKFAYEEIQKLYPRYFGNLTQEDFMLGRAKQKYDSLKTSIIQYAQSKALEGKITELINNDLEKYIRLQKEAEDTEKDFLQNKGKPFYRRDPFEQITDAVTNIAMADKLRLDLSIIAKREFDDFKKVQDDKVKVYMDALNKMSLGAGDYRDEQAEKEEKEAEKARKKAEREASKTKKQLESDLEELQKIKEKLWLARHGAMNDADELDEDLIKQFMDYLIRVRKQQVEILQQMKDDPAINAALEKEMEEFLMPTLGVGDAAMLNADLLGREGNKKKKKKSGKWAPQGDSWSPEQKAQKEELANILSMIADYATAAQDIVNGITDGIMERINLNAELQLANIDRIEKAQLDSLGRLTIGDRAREEEKARIELSADVRRKKIEMDKVRMARKIAVFQRGIDIAQTIASTVKAVMGALDDPNTPTPVALAQAFTVGSIGAAQLIKLMTARIPQFAVGTKSKPTSGVAMVGEKGSELVELPTGQKFLTPGTATLMDLPARTRIHPAEVTKKIMDNTLIQMASMSNVSHGADTMQIAMLEAFDQLSEDVKGLRADFRKKILSVTLLGDMDHVRRVDNAFGR